MIGERIRIIRSAKGYIQEYVAQEAGIKQPYYCKIERGIADPRWSVVVRIARVLRCSVKDFTDEDETGLTVRIAK